MLSSIVTNQSQKTSTVMFSLGKKEISTKLFCTTKLSNLSLETFVLSDLSPPQKHASFAFYFNMLSQNCSEKNDESKKIFFWQN